jgi:glycosyltransferase involved in cell wall biosynthesis
MAMSQTGHRAASALRVLHVRAGGAMYGAEKVVLTLARAQRARGTDAAVICIERPSETVVSERFRSENLLAGRVGFDGRIDLRAFGALRAALLRLRPDVVHTHDYKSNLLLAALRPFLRQRPALIATNHLWTQETRALRFYERLDALGMRALDRVVGVSTAICDEMRAARVPEGKLEVIFNGLDFAEAPAGGAGLRASLGLSAGTALVGFVGRLSVQKGLFTLLDAVERLSSLDACFALVGDGPLEEPLRQRIGARGLAKRVVLLGRRDDAQGLMRQFDLLALPSIREGTPMVLLEAMGLGTPVVASDVGGVSHVVVQGRTGLLFPSGDVSALCASIARSLGAPAERAAMARRAREDVRHRFSAAVMASRYDELYARVLAGLGRSLRAAPVPYAA